MEVSGNVRSIVGRVEGNNGSERRGSDSESRPLLLLPTWPRDRPPPLLRAPSSPLQPFSYAAADKEERGEEGISFLPFSFYLRQCRGGGKKGQKGLEEKEVRKIPSSPSSNGRTKRRKSIVQKVSVLFRKKPPGYLHFII